MASVRKRSTEITEPARCADDGGRIAGTRADIEHAVLLAQIERREREREIGRGADDLAAPQRQGDIAPREVAIGGSGEEVPRHRLEGAQHILVVHAARAKPHEEMQGFGGMRGKGK